MSLLTYEAFKVESKQVEESILSALLCRATVFDLKDIYLQTRCLLEDRYCVQNVPSKKNKIVTEIQSILSNIKLKALNV